MINKYLHSVSIVLAILLNHGYLEAQIVLEGNIYEKSTMKPLEHAVVTLSDISGDDIIAYKQSDSKGFFRLQTTDFKDTLRLSVALLGYSTDSRLVTS